MTRAAVSGKKNSGTLIFNSAGKLDTDNPVNRAYIDRHQAKMKAQIELRRMEAAIASADGFGVSAGVNAGLSAALASQTDGGNFVAQAGGGSERGNATFADAPQGVKGRGDFSSSEGTVAMAGAGKAHEMLSLPVGQLVRRFGSVDAIEKYSKILRDLSTADEREQKTQERRLLQVPKDFVVQRMFGYVDSLMNQLLDVPESVSDQVIAVALAGGDDVRVKVMRILSDNLTRCIAGAKEHIVGELDSLKNKYAKQDDIARELITSEIEKIREVG